VAAPVFTGEGENMTTAQTIATPLAAALLPAERNELSRKRLWTGRVLTGFSAAFFILDASMKFFKPQVVVEATVRLGYPESTIVGIGAALLVSTVLYLIPRTSVLGMVLLTGYLGGAVASNIRAQQVMFNILFPVICACIAWGGLYLRDARLEQMLPLNAKPE
jgi:hypothetical protein